MDERYEVLKDLFDFNKDLSVISSQLKSLDWDFDGEPLILKKAYIVSVINSFILGVKTAKELEDWANLVEMREDIDFEEEYETLINDSIHKLANPLLEGNITVDWCNGLLAKLKS